MVVHMSRRIATHNRPMADAGIDAVKAHKSSWMFLIFVDGADFQTALRHDLDSFVLLKKNGQPQGGRPFPVVHAE